jgi:hypothetical protein
LKDGNLELVLFKIFFAILKNTLSYTSKNLLYQRVLTHKSSVSSNRKGLKSAIIFLFVVSIEFKLFSSFQFIVSSDCCVNVGFISSKIKKVSFNFFICFSSTHHSFKYFMMISILLSSISQFLIIFSIQSLALFQKIIPIL